MLVLFSASVTGRSGRPQVATLSFLWKSLRPLLLPPRTITPIGGGALPVVKDPNLIGVGPPGKTVTLAVNCLAC